MAWIKRWAQRGIPETEKAEITGITDVGFRVRGHPTEASGSEPLSAEQLAEVQVQAALARKRNERTTSVVSWSEQQRAINLVKDAKARDLDTAEEILTRLWSATEDYEPGFCALADLYYMRGDYQRSLEIAIDSHFRAERSHEWGPNPPPAPLRLAAKAYRALGRQAKKAGDLKKAAAYYAQIVDLGEATENDVRALKRLDSDVPS